MMNLLGVSLDGLDLPALLAQIRAGFVVLSLLGVAVMARGKGQGRLSRIVLGVAILGHVLAWYATMFPLPNVYGANGSQDRENHLGWANLVALGFSPLHTSQVGHLHFEPLWPLLTAISSGFSVERVATVFQWAPVVVGLALLLSINFAWRRGDHTSEELPVEAAFAALGAVMLMAAPGDFAGPFRNPWALTFLLKPNHALGLALVPLAALAFSRARSLKTRLFAGFILQLVGWAFVIHMALFVAGLIVFVALSWLTGRGDRRRDTLDVAIGVGANLLLVSPYLIMLVAAYPFLEGNDAYRLSFFSERPLEGPLRMGALLLFSSLGAWQTYRDRGRLGRVLSSQWLASLLIWQAFPLLGLFGHAREQDEVFYWCRFWTGLFAGVGALHGAQLLIGRLRDAKAPNGNAVAAAVALALLTPSLLTTWWDPSTMDQYFNAARQPLPDRVTEPTNFIRTSTPREAVFAGDRQYAKLIAAYGARRVLLANSLNLPNDHQRRIEIETALLGDGAPALLEEGRTRYGIQYLLVTNQLDQPQDLTIDLLRLRPHLEPVYDRTFSKERVAIFRVIFRPGDR